MTANTLTPQEIADDIAATLKRVGLTARTEAEMIEEIRLADLDKSKKIAQNVQDALFALNYPIGHAAYHGDHKRGRMLNGQLYLLTGIEMLLEERL